ncbi:MAG TPA: hypothetical protein VMH00_13150 [Candidatus Limnocylindrales bacterium]|nr:hypothetical protein [Candidatus Limnocylindrales bacterium]
MKALRSGIAATANIVLAAAACALALVLATPAQLSRPSTEQAGGRSLSQAIVAYGFLRWDYLDFDQLLESHATLSLTENLKALDAALASLNCDVRQRMAGSHRTLILPPVPFNQWLGFPRTGGRNSPEDGWLFVTQTMATSPERVLVVFSTARPEHTTVFWLEKAGKGYATKLVFDSFKKGKISNEGTVMGAATSVKFESDNVILLKDWGEPGIGPREFTRVGRVFRLDLPRDTVTLVSPGTPSQH